MVNIQQLYPLPTLYLCVLYLSQEDKEEDVGSYWKTRKKT